MSPAAHHGLIQDMSLLCANASLPVSVNVHDYGVLVLPNISAGRKSELGFTPGGTCETGEKYSSGSGMVLQEQ